MSKRPEKPFEFPTHLLHQIAECSSDGAFFLVVKCEDGTLLPILHGNPTDVEGLSSFTQKYLAAMDSVSFNQMVDMFNHFEEEGLPPGEEEE